MKKIIMLFFSIVCILNISAQKSIEKIGNQYWTNSNLNVTTFKNGDLIEQISDDNKWYNAGYNRIPAWCYYKNDPSTESKYGKLYNLWAIRDPRGLAPEGFRIPTRADWEKLIAGTGGLENTSIYKSKVGWIDGKNGTNSTGMSFYPSGYRLFTGEFSSDGYYFKFFTSTVEEDPFRVITLNIINSNNKFSFDREVCYSGCSVRLVSDILPTQGAETASSNTQTNTQASNTPVSSLPDGDIIWKHSAGSFEFKFKEGDKRIWHEDGGRFIYVEQEFYNDGTMEGSGQLLKRKNENIYIKLTLDKCYYKDNNNQNWILIYNGGFYSKTLARYLVVDDFNKSSQSTSTSTSTTATSQSNVTVNKTVSNYKFTPPPALKITYTDNRKMCCCCNERYAQYKTNDKSKLEKQQKIFYCAEKLAQYHQENGNALLSPTRNQEQIDLDLTKLEDELLKIYPDYGLEIGFGCTMWYNLVSSGFTMKLCSTERQIDLYENIGNHCSQKCKNICGSCK